MSSKSTCIWRTSRTGRPSMVPTRSSLVQRSQRGPPSGPRRSRSVPGSRSRPGPSSSRRADRARIHFGEHARVSGLVSRLVGGWRTGLARPVLILQAGNALNYFGYGLILPFEIIYLNQIRGFSTSTAGLVLGAIMATAAIATPPTGALLDRYSPKAILVAGSVASAVGYAGFAFVDQPWQAFFCAIIGGVGNGAAGTANRVLVFRLVRPEQRAASVALSRVAGNFGLGLGATGAGVLLAAAQH